MCQCAEHVDYQLPNELTRVKYLLDAIDNLDPTLQASLALVRADEGPQGKMNDFEATAAFILPSDPVSTKRGKKRGANVSSADVSSSSAKLAKGPTTGVEFRYYELSEYKSLTTEQQDELRAWRLKSKPGKGKDNRDKSSGKGKGAGSADKKKFKSAVSAAVAVELTKRDKDAADQAEKNANISKYVLSVLNAQATTVKKPANATAGAMNAVAIPENFSTELNKIMSRASSKKI